MGLQEQIKAGAQFQRETISVVTNSVGSGSVAMGSVYGILSVQTSVPCRIRLYDNLVSSEDATEQARAFDDYNVPDTIALIGDFSMSAPGTYAIDPILFGVSETKTNPLTYYYIEPASNQSVRFGIFPIENPSIVPAIDSQYSVDNRRNMPKISASLAIGEISSGSFTSSDISNTYLLVSASIEPSLRVVRVRLYNNSGSINNSTEKTRLFSTEPSASVGLIVDTIVDSSGSAGLTYFAPKLIGANLQNLVSTLNLNVLDSNVSLREGNNSIHYIIENARTGAPAEHFTASFHVYSLED